MVDRPMAEVRETVSFKQLYDEVLIPKCISCHGSAGGINLESFNSCKTHLHEIERATLQAKTMPKSPVTSLNRRQLELLTAWIEAGGPDTPLGHGTPENQDGFAKIKREILDMKCLSCHSPGEEGGAVPLATKEDLLSSPLSLVVPGNPEASLLYTITAPGARNMMPPYGVEPLSMDQREILRLWIANGAQ